MLENLWALGGPKSHIMVFIVQAVYFKTNTSRRVELYRTLDGKIDFSEFSQEFGFDPMSIALNETEFPKEGVELEQKWEQIEELLKEARKPVGTEDHVMVAGEAAIHTVSTGMFSVRT